jgi:hypothetical protein
MSAYRYKPTPAQPRTERTLDERIQSYLDAIPGAVSGENGHSQTLKVATALVIGFALLPDDAWRYLQNYNQRCDPPWSERELDHKIREAAANKRGLPYGWLHRGDSLPPWQQAEWNHQPAGGNRLTAAQKIALWTTNIERKLKGWRATQADVWEASKIQLLNSDDGDACLLCHYLYEPGDLININCEFRINGNGRVDIVGNGFTRTTVEWCEWLAKSGVPQSDAGCWFRINPVLARQGSGKGGAYTDADIARFCYHLFEIDSVPLELQLSLFCKINVPITLISDSAGRSYHALVKSFARTQVEYEAESEYLHGIYGAFGVDPKNRNPSRYSRLPGVTRLIGARAPEEGETATAQRILYINPNPPHSPILP